jgi:Ca2+-transporting ATPase
LTTDGAPAIALAVENPEPGIMEEGPRKVEESIVEKVMLTGIAIQSVVLTSSVLGVYIMGLYWHTGSWDGKPPTITQAEKDARNIGVAKARTMAIIFIVFAELQRAYTSRALRVSIFTMGVFSNRFMQWAVGAAVGATIFIAHVPGVRDVFSMEILDGRSWGFLLGLSMVPWIFDELTKCVYRAIGFGVRPKAVNLWAGNYENQNGQNDRKEAVQIEVRTPPST